MVVPEPLADIVAALGTTGWAAEVADPDWRLVWASSEMRLVLRAAEQDLGIGCHMLERRRDMVQPRRVTQPSGEAWVRLHAPFVMHDTGATADDLREIVDPRYAHVLDGLQPQRPPARWSYRLEGEEYGMIQALGERVLGDDGRHVGTVFLYGSSLPASVLAFVARGNRVLFERMAELVEPGRRNAAVLFADVEGSTDRSRRLPSARYFAAIRELNTAVDDAILDEGGIIGKHAGDGVTAFFLVDQIGSISRAARAGISAARRIREAAARQEGEWRVNIGVHWGATLYMGQIATSGRLDVTALGDEVNECARIQEAAHSGQLLASKPLLERLDHDDAAALGIDPGEIVYCLLSELPDVSEKIRRDAGSLAIAEL